jgi:FkbM family methyltransferase
MQPRTDHDPAVTHLPIPGSLQVTVPANPALLTPFILEEQGDWFEGEMYFIRRLLRPGMAVVDIGANYGLYTLTCARLVGPEGRVWAYEPASLPRNCLARSIEANRLANVELVGKALSDRSGSARLGIAPNAELNSLNEPGQAGEMVPLTTLDAETSRWDRRIDFLKLDAEGEELRILSGARRFFAEHDPLVMFEHRHGATVNHGLIQAFTDLEMSLYRLLPGLNVLVPLPDAARADASLLNIFCCREERNARLREQGLLISAPAPLPPQPAADEARLRVKSWCGKRPWARCVWPQGMHARADAGSERLVLALSDLLAGDEPQRPAHERWAYQLRGHETLRQLIQEQPTVSRLYSAARVAMDLGERAKSVAMLAQARDLSGGGTAGTAPCEEFFLPPDRRHDDLDPGTASRSAVLQIMLEEPFLERCAYSIYFVTDRIAPLLRRIASNPLRSSGAKRRLAAARKIMRF